MKHDIPRGARPIADILRALNDRIASGPSPAPQEPDQPPPWDDERFPDEWERDASPATSGADCQQGDRGQAPCDPCNPWQKPAVAPLAPEPPPPTRTRRPASPARTPRPRLPPPPSRYCGIRLHIPYELASSHWVARRLPPNTRGTDFLVLCLLLLHSRALYGENLHELVWFELATEEDAGRLFAHVTDQDLAVEAGLRRQTVAQSIQRLEECGLLDILHLPKGFGRWHGRPCSDPFICCMGSKVYLFARGIEQVFHVVRETD